MTHKPKPSGQRDSSYSLHGGIPWPCFGDGTDYLDSIHRVASGHHTGTLQWVRWCQADGSEWTTDNPELTKPTKTKGPTAKPGAWFAVVAWDDRELADAPPTKVKVLDLVPAP